MPVLRKRSGGFLLVVRISASSLLLCRQPFPVKADDIFLANQPQIAIKGRFYLGVLDDAIIYENAQKHGAVHALHEGHLQKLSLQPHSQDQLHLVAAAGEIIVDARRQLFEKRLALSPWLAEGQGKFPLGLRCRFGLLFGRLRGRFGGRF